MVSELKARVYSLLRWTEKYTKTDMIYAGKSGFWLIANQTISVCLSLILSILFAHFLSKDTFGMYRYILSMAGVAAAFSLTGINPVITRAVAQGFDNILKPSIVEQLKWSIPRILFSLSISGYYFYQDHSVYGVAFLIVAFLAPLASTANSFGAFLYGRKDFKRSTIYGGSGSIINALAIGLVCVYAPSVVGLILAYYLSLTIMGGLSLWRVYKTTTLQNKRRRPEDITYARQLSLFNIVEVIALQIDSVLVYHLLGPAQLAIYTFATLMPERLKTILKLISNAALPRLSEHSYSSADRRVLSKVIVLLIPLTFILMTYVVAAPFLFDLLFTQYTDSVPYSQIYALTVFAAVTNITVTALYADRRQRELKVLIARLPFLKILISVVAISIFGLWGAIIGAIVYTTVRTLLTVYYTHHDEVSYS